MKKHKIFIIDDDDSVIEVLSEYFAFSDFLVASSSDPRRAIEEVKALKPDIILCDINMPGMSGFDVLKKIKEERSLSETGFILITSLDKVDIKVRGLEAGADDYITKPFSKAEVLARVRSVLRRTKPTNSDILKGSLNSLSLEEVLQMFDINKKSGIIRFEEIDGEIHINKGRFVTIRYKDFYDFDALCRLLLQNYGGFRINFLNENNEIEAKTGVADYLFSAVTYLDELKQMFKPEFEQNSLLIITNDKMAVFFGAKEVVLSEAIVNMPNELKENLVFLKEKHKSGEITLKD